MATKSKKNWIKGAVNPKHKGDCTGSKFGSPSCPKGSRKYNLAITFKRMAAKRKKK